MGFETNAALTFRIEQNTRYQVVEPSLRGNVTEAFYSAGKGARLSFDSKSFPSRDPSHVILQRGATLWRPTALDNSNDSYRSVA